MPPTFSPRNWQVTFNVGLACLCVDTTLHYTRLYHVDVKQDASKNYVNGLTSVVKYYDETRNRCRHLNNVNYNHNNVSLYNICYQNVSQKPVNLVLMLEKILCYKFEDDLGSQCPKNVFNISGDIITMKQKPRWGRN